MLRAKYTRVRPGTDADRYVTAVAGGGSSPSSRAAVTRGPLAADSNSPMAAGAGTTSPRSNPHRYEAGGAACAAPPASLMPNMVARTHLSVYSGGVGRGKPQPLLRPGWNLERQLTKPHAALPTMLDGA